MRTVTLSVIDRLLLRQLLPTQGGKIEMLLAGSITQTVEFTAAEITEFGLQDTGGSVTWANGRDVDFAFTPEQIHARTDRTSQSGVQTCRRRKEDHPTEPAAD